MAGFLFRLETVEGEPANPPTVTVAVPDWPTGSMIHVLGRWLLVGSCSLGLLTCAACGGSGKTVVPDLHGKTWAQSTKALADRDLCTPSKFTTAGSGNGLTVVAQDPGPGARVDRGTHVTLTLQGRPGPSDSLVDPLGFCPRP